MLVDKLCITCGQMVVPCGNHHDFVDSDALARDHCEHLECHQCEHQRATEFGSVRADPRADHGQSTRQIELNVRLIRCRRLIQWFVHQNCALGVCWIAQSLLQ